VSNDPRGLSKEQDMSAEFEANGNKVYESCGRV